MTRPERCGILVKICDIQAITDLDHQLELYPEMNWKESRAVYGVRMLKFTTKYMCNCILYSEEQYCHSPEIKQANDK